MARGKGDNEPLSGGGMPVVTSSTTSSDSTSSGSSAAEQLFSKNIGGSHSANPGEPSMPSGGGEFSQPITKDFGPLLGNTGLNERLFNGCNGKFSADVLNGNICDQIAQGGLLGGLGGRTTNLEQSISAATADLAATQNMHFVTGNTAGTEASLANLGFQGKNRSDGFSVPG